MNSKFTMDSLRQRRMNMERYVEIVFVSRMQWNKFCFVFDVGQWRMAVVCDRLQSVNLGFYSPIPSLASSSVTSLRTKTLTMQSISKIKKINKFEHGTKSDIVIDSINSNEQEVSTWEELTICINVFVLGPILLTTK